VDDAPRLGRPPISTATAKFIIKTMTRNSTTRGWSCARIASEVSNTPGWKPVSASTVYRTLTSEGYGVFKRTVKPGLTTEQMAERLKWCLDHKDEDWRHVIFSDETSVQLGGVRGKRRVWRKKEETFHEHVIQRRWKGFSEFMWWSCFSYYEKGPYHIWEPETLAEKKACQADLAARNRERYEEDRLAWEAQNALHRLHATRSQTGPRAAFKHTKETGAFVLEEGKGGINWYRYQMKVLKPLLLPFAKKLLQKFGKVKVQEDNAGPHASIYNQKVFQIEEIQRLLWPGNSPDLNAIEPTWFWMKRETTKKGAITSNEQLKEAWIKCWNDMPQELIQAWIDRIPVHIEEIIACKGNNLYKEGRKKGQEKKRIH
jgi:Transposase/DDE superfamily endonuclease